MSTTKKHQNFVSEPIGNKPVGALPGIGKVRATKLEDKGYDKAQAVLGQFLVQNRNEDRFRGWLKDTCDANAKQSRDCSGSLKEWSDNFM